MFTGGTGVTIMLMDEDVASFQYKQAAVRMFYLIIIIIIIVTIFCNVNNSRINQTLVL